VRGSCSFTDRVHYTGELFEQVKQEAMRRSSFTPADRVGFVSDTVALAKAGIIPTSQALNLVDSLWRAGEPDCTFLSLLRT
jgi:hypothetical protein